MQAQTATPNDDIYINQLSTELFGLQRSIVDELPLFVYDHPAYVHPNTESVRGGSKSSF